MAGHYWSDKAIKAICAENTAREKKELRKG
jgi:hypothetical protein